MRYRSEQMFLIVDNEIHTNLVIVCWLDDFARLVLLKPQVLQEANKYSSPSSLLVVKLV
jgi:hypothetical protein